MVDQMLLTRRRRPADGDAAFRAAGAARELVVDGVRTCAWRYGEGPHVAVLHGWDGSAADFRWIVPALVEAGMSVTAVDAPGHGVSGGDRSSVLSLARTLAEVVDASAPTVAVIAHSFGAPAAAWAISHGLRTERLVLVAPAAEPGAYVDALGALGGDRVRWLAAEAMGRRVGAAVDEVSLYTSAQKLTLPVTILHDRGDREVPAAASQALASQWPSASLLLTDGLGHRRILRDPGAVAAVVRAARGAHERSCEHGRLATGCASCALSRELYEPALRWG
jgi:pimeloyl-ACP methyl ester carboxylesterase